MKLPRRPAAVLAALALALGVAALRPRSAWAGDPDLVWRTLETPHFVINYHLEETRLAQRLALVAETAHDRLVPFLDHEVKHKTWVTLFDTSDDANGSATVLPYPSIELFATAPDDRSELNDYDDWLYALFTHEYTHVIHLDTVHGIARVVNAILGFGEWGQLYAPNQSQPRFLIEGLAVFEETERSSGGRLRSTIYDMWLRTASLEGKFQRLDQFSHSPIQWPRGGSPYLYGSAFLRYIASIHGPDIFRKLSHEYGGSWLPGGLNRALRRVTGGKRQGTTFEGLYDGFRASMAARYRQQLALVEATGRVEGTPLTGRRDYAARPIFSRDSKWILWSDYDGFDRARYRRIPVTGGKPETVHLVDGAGGSALSPDGKRLYFGAVEVHRNQYYWNDLFVVDLESGEKTQLTHGLRAEHPDLSPDGKWLAFSINRAGSRSLCMVPTDRGPDPSRDPEVTWLVGNRDDLSQIYTPSWSPDGRELVFSWWREGGFRDIWTLDVATRELTRVTFDRALDVDPRFSPDGRYIYFSSDRTGIYNLYAYERTSGRTFQVTNVIGGVFDVAISPDGRRAAFVGFQADGWNLQTLELDPARFRPAAPALLERPDSDVPRGMANYPSVPYRAYRTAWPGRLGVQSYPDAFGQVLSLSVSGSDVAGWHSWSAVLGISLARADDIYAALAWSYNRLFPSFTLSGYRLLTRRGGFFIDGINRAYTEEDWSLSASMGLPIVRRINQSSDLFFNYNLVWLRNADIGRLPLDPSLVSPRLPETGRVASLGLGWSWSNARRFAFSVSTEQGTQLAFNLGFSLKGIGSEYEVFTASWRAAQYIPMPWPAPLRNHVLALSYGGGLSGGELRRRSAFYLGGYPTPVQDVLRALFDFSRAGGATLRGYPFASVYGNEFHVLNAEYRFPILWIERGYSTFPVYFKRLHGVVYADFGNAFSGGWTGSRATKLEDWKAGAGGELRLDLNFFYYFGATLQLGYAHGFMKDGIDQVYFLLNNPF